MNGEENDPCNNKDCSGKYEYEAPENCSCHINPPCNACVNVALVCNICGRLANYED